MHSQRARIERQRVSALRIASDAHSLREPGRRGLPHCCLGFVEFTQAGWRPRMVVAATAVTALAQPPSATTLFAPATADSSSIAMAGGHEQFVEPGCC